MCVNEIISSMNCLPENNVNTSPYKQYIYTEWSKPVSNYTLINSYL